MLQKRQIVKTKLGKVFKYLTTLIGKLWLAFIKMLSPQAENQSYYETVKMANSKMSNFYLNFVQNWFKSIPNIV